VAKANGLERCPGKLSWNLTSFCDFCLSIYSLRKSSHTCRAWQCLCALWRVNKNVPIFCYTQVMAFLVVIVYVESSWSGFGKVIMFLNLSRQISFRHSFTTWYLSWNDSLLHVHRYCSLGTLDQRSFPTIHAYKRTHARTNEDTYTCTHTHL
jgi:hypothetical protein